MSDIAHTTEQKVLLADGFNIAATSLGVLGIALSTVAGSTIITGFGGFEKWVMGLSIALCGSLFSYSFFLGIAGYWNYDS